MAAALLSLQSRIDHLVEIHDHEGFDPWADASDTATVGMVLMLDMRNALKMLSGRMCRTCEGDGFVGNPDARYTEDYADGRPTGVYSTNDPEEIDCPDCGGVGFKARERSDPALPPPPEPNIAF